MAFQTFLTVCIYNVLAQQKETTETKKDFKFWTWVTADAKRTDASFQKEFDKYTANGIDAIRTNTYADPKLLARLVANDKKTRLRSPCLEVYGKNPKDFADPVNKRRPSDKARTPHYP